LPGLPSAFRLVASARQFGLAALGGGWALRRWSLVVISRLRLVLTARELLSSLHPAESGYSDETIATPVLALASFVRSAPEGGGNVVTVPGSDGWVTLHASLPGPAGERRVAVVLERATGAHSAPVRLEADRRDRPRARGRDPPRPWPLPGRNGRDSRRLPVDLLFFRHRFLERLLANVGIVLVFAAFYLRFLKRA
jgi:hypothetical protein